MMEVVNRFRQSLILVTRTDRVLLRGGIKEIYKRMDAFLIAVMNGIGWSLCVQNAFRLPIKLSI